MSRVIGVASTAWNKFLKNILNASFIFLFVLLMIYMKLNGGAHFSDWDQSYGQLIDAYIIMTVILLFWAARRTKEAMMMPFHKAAGIFGLFFMITLAIMYTLVYSGVISTAPQIDPSLFWPTILLQFGVVATFEELMFRGVVLDVTHSVLISAFIFAIFHLVAYQIIFYDIGLEAVDFVPVIFAFGFGIILGIVALYKNAGIIACISIHGVYNSVVVGALVLTSNGGI